MAMTASGTRHSIWRRCLRPMARARRLEELKEISILPAASSISSNIHSVTLGVICLVSLWEVVLDRAMHRFSTAPDGLRG